jgi:signal peptidase I
MTPLASGSRRLLRWLVALTAVLAVSALWTTFAPAKLGGSVNYAVIYGVSMEPHLHGGDLVLLRARPAYGVGDAVAYHNLQLGRVVLHRIVGRVGDRYVFEGDNNSFLDSYNPTRSDLVGREWVSIPWIGNAFTWLHRPNHAAIVVGVLTFLLLAGGGLSATHRHRRNRRHQPASAPAPSNRGPIPLANLKGHAGHRGLGVGLASGKAALVLGGGAAVAFALVSLLVYTHPLTDTTQSPGAYSQEGTYSYGAKVGPSSVYPSGRIVTGETVFTRLARSVQTRFDYRLVTSLPHTATGSASLAASLASSSGWSKTLTTPQSVRFHGDHVLLTRTLNLARLTSEVASYLKLTGIPADTFSLLLTPHVTLDGTAAGAALHDTFAPAPLIFTLDSFSLRLQHPSLGATPGQAPSDPFHPSQPGSLLRQTAATLKLGTLHVRVSTARPIGLIGLAAALALALLGLLLSRSDRREDELGQIRRQSEGLLVPVSSAPAAPATGYLDLANFESLAYLARSYQRVILHHQQGDSHGFYIDDDGSLYRYQLRANLAPPTDKPQAANASTW